MLESRTVACEAQGAKPFRRRRDSTHVFRVTRHTTTYIRSETIARKRCDSNGNSSFSDRKSIPAGANDTPRSQTVPMYRSVFRIRSLPRRHRWSVHHSRAARKDFFPTADFPPGDRRNDDDDVGGHAFSVSGNDRHVSLPPRNDLDLCHCRTHQRLVRTIKQSFILRHCPRPDPQVMKTHPLRQ